MAYTFNISVSILRDEYGAQVLEVSLPQLWLPYWSHVEVLESACSWQDTKPFLFNTHLSRDTLFSCLPQSPQETHVAFFRQRPTLFCTSPPQSTNPNSLKPFH